ncbi:hypothetical protein SAMN06297164_3461 [Nitrosomonas ureae]|uniref:Uncharacterized protein n=1 Tax=Nitrosomonas ureae TaxID=44577 RepID=A0A286AKH3_9PROT|nr:hypothetical protein SAMN06297164_3461 [Nitrosomonas ureae]
MLKKFLIYEIHAKRFVSKYFLEIPDENLPIDYFSETWNMAIKDGLVEKNKRKNYVIAMLSNSISKKH